VAKYVNSTSEKLLGGFYMKGKLIIILGFAGVLALSIGLAKTLQKTEVSTVVPSKQTDTYKLVTREEQVRKEGMVAEGKDVTTVISVEEQNIVENSSVQQGNAEKSNAYAIEGRIIQLEKDRMTVINGVSKEMIEKYSAIEIFSKRHGEVIIFYLKDTSKKFKIGQLVRVWRDKDSPIKESDPLQMYASTVEIMED